MNTLKRILIAAVLALHACPIALHAQLNLAMPAASLNEMPLSGSPTTTDHGGIAAISFTAHSAATANPYASAGNAYRYIGGAETLGAGFASSASIYLPAFPFSQSNLIATNNTANVDLRFGSSTGTATDTWSLGSDIAGVDYYLDVLNNAEERIYRADPTKVEIGIYFDGTKVITLNYSPIYMLLDYNTSDPTDDVIQAYSDPVGFNVVSGLTGTSADFANALATEISAAGGYLQLAFNSIQPASVVTGYSNAYGDNYGLFAASGSLQVVSLTAVPEPSTYALIAGILMLGLAIYRRRSGA